MFMKRRFEFDTKEKKMIDIQMIRWIESGGE